MPKNSIRLVTIAIALGAVSSFAHAQSTTSAESISKVEVGGQRFLTDQRIDIIKAALELRSDQTQYWPAVEQAIRSRATGREGRLAAVSGRLGDLGDRSIIETLRDRNPVEFLQRRSAILAQRATELKSLADAWQPLYQTLTPDQRRRMAFLTMFVLREMRDSVEQRRMETEDEDES